MHATALRRASDGREHSNGGRSGGATYGGPSSPPSSPPSGSSRPGAVSAHCAAASPSSSSEKKTKRGGINVEGTTWRTDPARRRARTERTARAAEMERWKAGGGGGDDGGDGGGAAQVVGHVDASAEDEERGFEDEDRRTWRATARQDANRASVPPLATGTVSAEGNNDVATTPPRPPRVTRNPLPTPGWEEKMRGTAAAALYGRRSDEGEAGSSAPSAPTTTSSGGGDAPSENACLYPPPSPPSSNANGGSNYAPSENACLYPPPGPLHSSGRPGSNPSSYAGSSSGGVRSESHRTGSSASTWVHPGTPGGSTGDGSSGVRSGSANTGSAASAWVSPGSHAEDPAGRGDRAATNADGPLPQAGTGLRLPRYLARQGPPPSGSSSEGVAPAAHPAAHHDVNGDGGADGDGSSGGNSVVKWHQKRRNRLAMLLVALVVAAGGITAGVLLSGNTNGGGGTTQAQVPDNRTEPDVDVEPEEGEKEEDEEEVEPPPTKDVIDLTPPTNAQMAAEEQRLIELVRNAFPPSRPFLEGSIGSSTQRRAIQWLASHPPDVLLKKYPSDASILTRYSLAVLYLSTTFREVEANEGEESVGAHGRIGWMMYTKDACEWEGVSCSEEGEVEVLDLSGFLEEGTVPSELAVLGDSLKELYLQSNGLGGSLPAPIGQLKNLEVLSLFENLLVGNIPAEYGDLQNLQSLYVYKNQLEGTVPAEVCSLTETGALQFFRADCLSGGELVCECCTHCCDDKECCQTGVADDGTRWHCSFLSN